MDFFFQNLSIFTTAGVKCYVMVVKWLFKLFYFLVLWNHWAPWVLFENRIHVIPWARRREQFFFFYVTSLFIDRLNKAKSAMFVSVDVFLAFNGTLFSDLIYSSCTFEDYLGRVKRKCAFEHIQNAQIILRMRNVSTGPLLSIDRFYRIQWFC